MAGGASRLRRAARRIGFPCATFSRKTCLPDFRKNISSSGKPPGKENVEERTAEGMEPNIAKNHCTICLEPLICDGTDGQAVFTAQCMHSFHFVCISSNVRHGSVNCPICRAHWTHLPRDLTPARLHSCTQVSDPILQILDDSIANFRVHRRSSLRSTRYDDDDPVEADLVPAHRRIQMALIPLQVLVRPEYIAEQPPCLQPMALNQLQYTGSSSVITRKSPVLANEKTEMFLSVRLSHQQATDVVLVASPNGPHLRLLKQSMALVVFSLRPADRLAIVTYSSAATRAFPLRRMTSNGKRMALQVIDRLIYLGEADPIEGLKKGVKILEDRTHQNPLCCILHLSDSPTRAYVSRDLEVPIPVHRFHIGFGFGGSNGFVMHEFEEFLLRLLGGVIRETQLRIGEEGELISLGELRAGEDRRIPLGVMADSGFVSVSYSYIEGGVEECLRTGEVLVGIEEKNAIIEGRSSAERTELNIGGRRSNVDRWDYLDPFMARRWAKHLHGCRT